MQPLKYMRLISYEHVLFFDQGHQLKDKVTVI